MILIWFRSSSYYSKPNLPPDTRLSTGATAEFECQFGTVYPRSCNDEHVFTYYKLEDSTIFELVLHKKHSCLRSKNVEISIKISRYEPNISKVVDKDVLLEYRYTFYIHDIAIEDNGSLFSCHIMNNGQIQWQKDAQLFVYSTSDNNSDENHSDTIVATVVVTVVFCALSTINSL